MIYWAYTTVRVSRFRLWLARKIIPEVVWDAWNEKMIRRS